jgi:hypothetical protein
MSDSELAVVAPQTFAAPILIERAGPSTRKKFFEFFYGPDPQRAHTGRLLPGDPAVPWPGVSVPVTSTSKTLNVALYLNRRLWPFTALNSWTGSLSTGFNSWTELHLNRGLPRPRERVYDLSTVRQRRSWTRSSGICPRMNKPKKYRPNRSNRANLFCLW